jgi:hypothetical protein
MFMMLMMALGVTKVTSSSRDHDIFHYLALGVTKVTSSSRDHDIFHFSLFILGVSLIDIGAFFFQKMNLKKNTHTKQKQKQKYT